MMSTSIGEVPAVKVTTERARAGGHVDAEAGWRSVHASTFARRSGETQRRSGENK